MPLLTVLVGREARGNRFFHETLTPIRRVSSQELNCQILSALGVHIRTINVAVNVKFVS